jgi:transposase
VIRRAHVQRKFYDITVLGDAPIATQALLRIGKLYKIEDEIRGSTLQVRRATRRVESKAIIDELKPWFEVNLRRASKGSPLADAIGYGLRHWDGLVRFLDDGRTEIESNTVERSIRPINGHDQGAANWGMAGSLVETCKLNGVYPLAWMTDTLTKLVNLSPASRIDALMPWAYPKIVSGAVKVG